MRTSSSGSSRWLGRAAIFASGCAVIVAVSGSFRAPADAARGVGYFSASDYAAAAAGGTITLSRFDPWIAGPDDAGSGDDIGYPVVRQAWLLLGGDGSDATIVELHNVFFLSCAMAFAAAGALMMRSLLAGWLCLALALALRHALRGLLFGALDNRTLIVGFPLAFILLVVILGPATRRLPRAAAVLLTLAIGGVVALADLLRHSEGLLAFAGIVLACLLVPGAGGRRLAAAALVVTGSILVTYAVPVGVRLFNDLGTGRPARTILADLRPLRPSYHSAWHSLQISLGRYPNPEGLTYNDLTGFVRAEQMFPEVVKIAGPYEAARRYYFWYVRTHPREWLRTLVRGTLEVFSFIPYTLSVGNLPWALGYLPAKEGVVPDLIEEPTDVPFDLGLFPRLKIGHGILLNLRLRYLKLTATEWLVFLASLACLSAAIWTSHATGDAESRRIFLSLLSYVGLGVIARALVPVFGQALVVAFYGTAILALAYLVTGRRGGAAERRALAATHRPPRRADTSPAARR